MKQRAQTATNRYGNIILTTFEVSKDDTLILAHHPHRTCSIAMLLHTRDIGS